MKTRQVVFIYGAICCVVAGGLVIGRSGNRAPAVRDPIATIAAIEAAQGRSKTETIRATDQVLADWALTDPEAAWNWAVDSLTRLPPRSTTPGETAFGFGPTRLKAVMGTMIGTGRFDVAGRVVAKGANEPNSLVVLPLAVAWVKKDPAAAKEWLTRLPAGLTRANAIVGVARGLAETSPESATEFFLGLPVPREKSYAALGTVYGLGIRGGAPEAQRWVDEHCRDDGSGSFTAARAAAKSIRTFP